MKAILLSKGYTALVDDEDFQVLSKYKWYCSFQGYAVRTGKKSLGENPNRIFLMHNQMMKTPKGMHTDHVNGDKLDNRRNNLRVCTVSQNLQNSKIRVGRDFKGVFYTYAHTNGRNYTRKNPFMVRVKNNRGKNVYIGYFEKEHYAAMAYDLNARAVYGKYAKLNFPGAIYGGE